MRQQLLAKKGAHSSSSAHSSHKSGHYNPYTLQYVPAPSNEQLQPSISTNEGVHVGDGRDYESESNDGDSIPGWDMEIDEDDSFFAEYKDQQELGTRDYREEKSTAIHFPPSNFCLTTNKSASASMLPNSDFMQASSVVNKRASYVPTISTSRSKSISSSRKCAATNAHQKKNKNLSAPPLDSPEPQLMRKRQGESIVKATVPQESK